MNRTSATTASVTEPHHQHEDSTPRVEHRGGADIRLYLDCILPQSGDPVPLTAALELLREGLEWHQLTKTDILNACLKTAGRLHFQVKEGQVVIFRGKPVCNDVSVLQPLPQTLEGEFFPAVVRHIVSPEAIVVNLPGDLSNQLAALHNEMNLFYSPPDKGGTGGQEIAAQYLVPGALCAYKYVDMFGSGADKWCRGVVTSVHPNGMIKVTDIDTGVKSQKPITSLRQLTAHFCMLPRQAITVRLYGIRPANRKVWDLQACFRLAELVWGVTVMCHVVGYVYGVPAVIMCNTNGPEDIYPSIVLIEECLAIPRGSSDDEE